MSTPESTTSTLIPLKNCSKCGKEKPLTSEYFAWRTEPKPGWRLNCRACTTKQARVRYEAKRDEILAREKRRYAAQGETIKAKEMERYWARQAGTFAPAAKPLVIATEEDALNALTRTERMLSRKADGRTALKHCSKCGIEKPWTSEYFHERTDRKRGLAYRCKDCQRELWQADMQKNPEKYRVRSHARHTRERQLPVTLTPEQWKRCLQYWGYSCAYCGREEGFAWTLAMDHFIPLAHPLCPGATVDNCLPACHGIGGCNNKKSKQNAEIWLTKKLGKKGAHKKLQEIEQYFKYIST